MNNKTITHLVKNIKIFPNYVQKDILAEYNRILRKKGKTPSKSFIPDINESLPEYYKHRIIIDKVKKYFDIEDIKEKRRFRELVEARTFAIYFLNKITSSTISINGAFVDYPHDLYLYHKKSIQAFIDMKDKKALRIIEELEPIIREEIETRKTEQNKRSVIRINKLSNKEIEVYDDITTIVKDGYSKEAVINACNGHRKTSGGFKWEWGPEGASEPQGESPSV